MRTSIAFPETGRKRIDDGTVGAIELAGDQATELGGDQCRS